MTILENDIELLEEYLDGTLDAAAQTMLRTRLAADQQLADALAQLQSQRAIRQAAFKAMEPDDATVQRLMWRVRGATLDQQRTAALQPRRHFSFLGNQWRIASMGSAAAACMFLGFTFGRLGHSNTAAPNGSGVGTSVVSTDTRGPTIAQVKNPDDQSSQFTAVGTAPRISVPITNEYGQVVAWQTFDNPEQAKNFTEELHSTRNASQPPVNSSQPKLVDSPQQY
jgi:anti-sigma factor RsiW